MLKVLFPWKQNNTKKVLFAMEQVVNGAGPSADEQPPGELPLLPCHVCNRTFLPKPLKKHIPICEQTARRKRKPFDSLKQRVEGTDMAPFYQKSYLKKSNPEISSQAQAGDVYGNNKQSKWREKHVELQNTIKNAKGTKPDMNTNLPSNNHTSITPNRKVGHLTVNQTSSNERCPVCDRSFGPKAFDRHVEFCKEQKNRVQVHKSPAVVQQAKERLEARINYRVPPLRQSKRNLIRDKYSPSSQTNLLHRSNTIVSGKSTTSLASSVTTMLPNRRQPTNNNEKIIERNNKKDLGSKVRLDRAIGDCGDTKQAMKNDNNGNKSFHTKRTIPAKKINKTEINDGLQGLTVSSLCVEKNKKLVTWKDTVKAQAKVTTSISLTTTNSSVKRRAETTPQEEEPRPLRDLDKVPSLGKVVRSKLLMEKLNKFVSKKNRSDLDISEDFNLTIFENACATKKTASKTDNLGLDGIFNEEAENFLELTNISEEGEDESPKKAYLESTNASRKRADFCGDENTLNLTQDIENSVIGRENLIQLLNKEDNFLKKYELSSSTETSDHECDTKTVQEECNKYDSGEDTKTEDTSSLCLRLPLEGLESKVKLKNNDLDPEEKLKKNIKSFYDIMKTRRCNAAQRREQLRLLESSKELPSNLDSTPQNTLNKDSLTSSNSEVNVVEKFEMEHVSEKIIRELVTDVETAETAVEAIPDKTGDSERKIDNCSIAVTRPDEKASHKTVSKKAKTWKRRKKLMKCRMCVKCFIRNGIHRILGRKNLVSGNKKKGLLSDHETSENETVFDSPQILQEESAEELPRTPAILVDVLYRKSRSADCITTEQSLSISEKKYVALETENGSRSLPNISLHEISYQKKYVDYDLPAENSFDNIIPRKRRKISPSYLNLTSEDEREVEKNLKNNISKIRKRKKEEEPPLILNYEKIYTGGSKISAADILYVNEVFTCSITPERSELESVNDFEDDGIQEYGDEELEEWEAAEEELRKELERNKMMARCDSPTKLHDSVDVERENRIENRQSVSEINRSESVNTLKNSSACTIVNVPYEKSESAKNLVLPTLGGTTSHEIGQSSTRSPAFDSPTKTDKIPCRLPRIIPQNKHPIPSRSLKESMGDSFKLPPIGKDVLMKEIGVEVSMPSDKMVQVPSRNDKESFSQQTSQLMVDHSSSFNTSDLIDSMKNRLSFTKPTNTVNYDPFEQAHLQLMELIEDDNLTPSPTYSTTMSTHSTPNVEFRPFVTTSSTPKTAIVKSNGKRASVIDPPYSFQDNRASRDLDKEFELLESLVNNNLESEPKERSSLRCRDFGDDVDAIDPNLINEQDNLFIPEHLPSDDNSPSCNAGHVRSVDRDRESKRTVEPLQPRLSRRPTRLAVKPTTRALPLIGPDQVRLAPDGSSAESQAGEGRRASPRSFQTNKTKSKMKIDFSPESLKNKNSRMIGTGSLSKQNGLEFGKVRAEGLEELTPRQETVNLNITPTAEELYPDNPAMYEEFRKYEEMYRREKEGKSSSSKKQRKKTSDFGINIEDTSKTYEDSTYGRKQQMDEQDLDQVEELVRNMLPTATTPGERLPKFCHECGNKYPVASAKFCVECGIKRLVL